MTKEIVADMIDGQVGTRKHIMNNLMAKRDTSKHRTEYVGNYKISRRTSIFTSRYNGNMALDDVTISETHHEKNWGGRDVNGKYYSYVAILKAESGNVKRGKVDTIPSGVMDIATSMLDTQDS